MALVPLGLLGPRTACYSLSCSHRGQASETKPSPASSHMRGSAGRLHLRMVPSARRTGGEVRLGGLYQRQRYSALPVTLMNTSAWPSALLPASPHWVVQTPWGSPLRGREPSVPLYGRTRAQATGGHSQ